MVSYLTLDSSVIVAALKKDEPEHRSCRLLLEKVKNGEYIAIEPYTVLVEVVAAIKRRTNSPELAERIKNDLKNIGTIYFFELVKYRAEEAADIAKEHSVRGMDAIVIQIAKENNSTLVTLDEEILKIPKSAITTKLPKEVV